MGRVKVHEEREKKRQLQRKADRDKWDIAQMAEQTAVNRSVPRSNRGIPAKPQPFLRQKRG